MRNLIRKVIAYFYELIVKIVLTRKISKIYNGLYNRKNPSKFNIKKHFSVWADTNIKPNLKWYKVFFSINNIDDPRYVTEVHYYNLIEPIMNNKGFCEAYSDKNIYHKFLDPSILPAIYLRSIHGSIYDESYCPITYEEAINSIPLNIDKLITKQATDTGGGRGILLYKRINNKWINNDNENLTLNNIISKYKTNFIIQEYIEQHTYFSKFNPSSVNTVRLLTYRSVSNNQIILLHAILRIGQPGSFVDNQASGGISCGISHGGILNNFAVDKNGRKYFKINGYSLEEESTVYKFEEIVSKGFILAPLFVHHRLLGFDFCVDISGNIKLIEVNNKNNEINFFQMNNGVLFGDYTDEIISYCRNNKRSFCFDFYQ